MVPVCWSIYILLTIILVSTADDLQPWMKWAYYLSPMSYGQNAIVINEFLDPRWNTVSSIVYGQWFCSISV